MIRNLLQNLPKRQFILTTRNNMNTSQPRDVSESEEKNGPIMEDIIATNILFDKIETSTNEDNDNLKYNVEKDKWCS